MSKLYKIIFLYLILLLSLVSKPVFAQSTTNPELDYVEFSESFKFSEQDFYKLTKLKKGLSISVFNIPLYVNLIESQLSDNGFLFARIDSVQQHYSQDRKKLGLKFYGKTGRQVRIGKFELQSDSIPKQRYLAEIGEQQGKPFAGSLVDRIIQNILSFSASQGFAFAEVKTGKPAVYNKQGKMYTDVLLNIHENERIYIRDIIFDGNTFTKTKVLLRELPVSKGSLFTNKVADEIPEKLMRSGILKSAGKPEIFRVSPDSVALKITVEEGNASTFDGVVGYIPDRSNGSGYFTGLIDISFKNLFGTGRKFLAHWKKPDALSEEFSLAYREPWLMDFPLDAGVQLDRTVRDTTFIQWSYALDTRVRLFQDLSILAKIQRLMYIPDSAASRDFRLVQNQVLNAEIGLEYDIRDYPLNPRNGLYYSSSYSYGLKKNTGPAYVIEEDSLKKNEDLQGLQVQLQFFYNLWSNQVLALNLTGMQVKGSRLQITDYFWFGGSRSLRGYRENQFRGSQVAWSNLEYRYLMGRNARLFLFTDFGYYRYKADNTYFDDFLVGYGLGVRLDTPLGILGVDYGLAKGESFRDGKIHFGLINQF